MNWEAIGAVGEVAGAIAVVMTLAYLAIQIKQSNIVARCTVRQSIADSITSMATSLELSDDLASIMQKKIDGEELEPHELRRLEARCYGALRKWQNIYFQYGEGLVSTEEWESYRLNLDVLLQNKFYQDYWHKYELTFTAQFRDEVASIISESRKNWEASKEPR
jgi:hypothetical protein